ncbi:MAG: glutathione peroxidase [Oscillospiraceae bacterium]|nr:glutathione peroxidase [Oscillospiraceae bacterium]
MTLYDINIQAADGRQVSMADHRGKVLLIVNTATGCGFTPQYTELQEMYTAYQAQGFEILDFPCNQFGEQAPGSDEEIHTFCTGRFGITFPQFAKVDVNGENAAPLFRWLTGNTTFDGFDRNPAGLMMTQMLKGTPGFKTSSDIKWNFTKFLIDREGRIVSRFEPMTPLKKVRAQVEALL